MSTQSAAEKAAAEKEVADAKAAERAAAKAEREAAAKAAAEQAAAEKEAAAKAAAAKAPKVRTMKVVLTSALDVAVAGKPGETERIEAGVRTLAEKDAKHAIALGVAKAADVEAEA